MVSVSRKGGPCKSGSHALLSAAVFICTSPTTTISTAAAATTAALVSTKHTTKGEHAGISALTQHLSPFIVTPPLSCPGTAASGAPMQGSR